MQTLDDGRFRVSRVVLPVAGTTHVLFYATDLVTGRTMRLGESSAASM